MKLYKLNLKISNMVCKSCEHIITTNLSNLKGIKSVKANHLNSTVTIYYNDSLITQEEIIQNLNDLGYYLKTTQSTIQLVSILIILLGMYVIAKQTGIFNASNIFSTVNVGTSFFMIFFVGMLTSIHCIAMCGGINMSQSLTSGNSNLAKSNLLYNLGRIVSYTIIGVIVGSLGMFINVSNYFKAGINIFAGIFMIIIGINFLNIFPKFKINFLKLPKSLTLKINNFKKNKSSFVIGLLNGLMPCGPLQSMQVFALTTGSPILGGLSMFLFGLGTLPLMFGLGILSNKLNTKFSGNLLKVSAFIVIVFGLNTISSGVTLSGISLFPSTDGKYSYVQDNKQIVTTNLDHGSYEPIIVQKDIPLEWTLYADKEFLNGCNNEIIIPKYNISVKLKEGENLIKFTPNKSEIVTFSCWMGMIKSNIIVK